MFGSGSGRVEDDGWGGSGDLRKGDDLRIGRTLKFITRPFTVGVEL